MLNDNPIFIGGDGRSGTTLLNVILDCHPELSMAPELHFTGDKIINLGPYALNALEIIRGGGKLTNGKRAVDVPEWKPGIQFILRTQRTGITLDEIELCIKDSIESTNSELETFPDRCDLVQRLGRTLRHKDNKSRWGFKIMKEIKNPEKYKNVWENSQVLHIIRDGRDVASSQMLDHGSWGYGHVTKAAENWVKLINSARKNSDGVSYHEVRYEDLIFNSESCIRSVCEFLGVDFHASMLEHQKQPHRFYKTKVAHPSRKRTMKSIDSKAVGRYKKDLTTEQISDFEHIAAEMLESLRYEVASSKRVEQ